MTALLGITPEVMSDLATAPIFKKIGKVVVKKNESGKLVVLDTHGGTTIHTAEEFKKLYETTDEENVYQPRTYCRAISTLQVVHNGGKTPVNQDQEMILALCDKDGELIDSTTYQMNTFEFGGTYARA